MRGVKRWALALMLAVAACGGDEGGGVTPQPDANTGGTTDAGTAGIPLALWVDDLLEHRTTDDALPDTTDDKVVIDNEDPELFNHWLVQPGQ